MMRTRDAVCCAAAALLLTAAVPAGADAPFGASQTGARTQWWRASGHLRAANGARFSYVATFFRFAGPTPAFVTADVAIAAGDEAPATAFRLERERAGEAGASSARLAVRIADWSLEDRGGIALRASARTATLALRLQARKPAAELGAARGVAGPCATCALHLRAYTRMSTTGSVTAGGRTFTVTGDSWLDHVWGDELLGRGGAGWDWFELQFDDGRDLLMAYPRGSSRQTANEARGFIVGRSGAVTPLAGGDVAATVRGGIVWRSPHTNARYPSLWEISSGVAGIAASLSPVTADQELRAPRSGEPYWDGAVVVHDDPRGGVPEGAGFVTLTGYARPLHL